MVCSVLKHGYGIPWRRSSIGSAMVWLKSSSRLRRGDAAGRSSLHGCFYQLGVHFWGVLTTRSLLFLVSAPDCWKLPRRDYSCSAPGLQVCRLCLPWGLQYVNRTCSRETYTQRLQVALRYIHKAQSCNMVAPKAPACTMQLHGGFGMGWHG